MVFVDFVVVFVSSLLFFSSISFVLFGVFLIATSVVLQQIKTSYSLEIGFKQFLAAHYCEIGNSLLQRNELDLKEPDALQMDADMG